MRMDVDSHEIIKRHDNRINWLIGQVNVIQEKKVSKPKFGNTSSETVCSAQRDTKQRNHSVNQKIEPFSKEVWKGNQRFKGEVCGDRSRFSGYSNLTN